MNKQKLEKLTNWIKEIKSSCENLKIKSYFYKEFLEIVKSNKEISSPPDFHEWVARNYYESALMNIRRLLDDHRGVISLHNILNEIRENPELITKEWYLDNVKKEDEENGLPTTADFAEDFFKRTFTDDGINISKTKIENDLGEIFKLRLKVERYIDNCLAHQNEGKKGKLNIKTQNIEDVILEIEKLTIKYLDLFKMGCFTTLLPVYQYVWQKIFYKPWIKPRD